MKYRSILSVLVLAASVLTLSAKTPSRVPSYTTMPDKYQSGAQQYAYPVPDKGVPALTPAPKGYAPFHMEHYGRHGSRWLIGENVYSRPVRLLEHADSLGQLTPSGQELLRRMRKVAEAYKGHDGELTEVGARQHRGIANRMSKNFPQMFTDSTYLDAKSTQVIRCILSMANEVAELERLNPGIRTRQDASASTQPIMGPPGFPCTNDPANDNKWRRDSLAVRVNNDHSAFIAKVFKDPELAKKELKADKIFNGAANVALNSQSHDGLYDIYEWFTLPELQGKWKVDNAKWYIHGGNTSLTDHRPPYRVINLLRDMMAGADTAVVSKNPTVNLRFGHDSVVVPFVCMLQLGTFGADTDNLEKLQDVWRDYEMTPMAANIQFVFYRPEGKGAAKPEDVLVKVLHNEKETTLPIPTKTWPYYKWTDVRDYWQSKVDTFNEFCK